MAAETPIHQMGLAEARRSLLVQVCQLRDAQMKLDELGLERLPDEDIEERVNDLMVRNANMFETIEHIETMASRA